MCVIRETYLVCLIKCNSGFVFNPYTYDMCVGSVGTNIQNIVRHNSTPHYENYAGGANYGRLL